MRFHAAHAHPLLLLIGTFHAATVSGVFDVPLKKCPPKLVEEIGAYANQIADPNWIDVDSWAYCSGAPNPSKPFNALLIPRAALKSPYRPVGYNENPILSQTDARFMNLRRWSMQTGNGNMNIEDLLVYTSSTTSIKARMGELDFFTSATFLGDRHVAVSTGANFPYNSVNERLGGSQIARLILIDLTLVGTTKPCAFQLYPIADPDSRLVLPAPSSIIYGCHADSYAEETMAAWKSTLQSFSMVCMMARETKIVLTSLEVQVHTKSSRYSYVTDSGNLESKLLSNVESEIDAISPMSLQTFPVHVIGKRTVLYRCQKTFDGTAGVAHWCWRNFGNTGWDADGPALTTAVLPESVLQNGMFLGWSGSERPRPEVQSTRVYFLDRNSRSLYTLSVHDQLHIVHTNILTAMYKDTPYNTVQNYSLLLPKMGQDELLFYYGELRQYYRFDLYSSNPPLSVDEALFLIADGSDPCSIRCKLKAFILNFRL